MPSWLRSILSVVIGFVVFYALQGACSLAAAKLFDRNFDVPTTGYLLVALTYTFLSALIGGYVAARLAPTNPLLHGIALAVLMLPLMALNFKKGFGGQETWFVLARSAVTPLFAIAGAALDSSRHRRLQK